MIPVLHELTHLPVVVDPSHATGHSGLVPSMALAATAGGADGLMIEVHDRPLQALSDGAQALRCQDYAALSRRVRSLRRTLSDECGREEDER